MAKFEGHRCDRQDCSSVATIDDPSKQRVPEGWYILDPVAPDGKKFELCSARCVRLLAKDREALEAPPSTNTGRRVFSTESKKNMAAANAVRWHKAGKHQDELRDGCPMCEELTAPEAEVLA